MSIAIFEWCQGTQKSGYLHHPSNAICHWSKLESAGYILVFTLGAPLWRTSWDSSFMSANSPECIHLTSQGGTVGSVNHIDNLWYWGPTRIILGNPPDFFLGTLAGILSFMLTSDLSLAHCTSLDNAQTWTCRKYHKKVLSTSHLPTLPTQAEPH